MAASIEPPESTHWSTSATRAPPPKAGVRT
jgi:hypothetical protein